MSIALNYLGLVFMRQNLTDKAITHFKRSIEIDPAYAKAHLYLGRAIEIRGLHAEAAQELQMASDLWLDLRSILKPEP